MAKLRIPVEKLPPPDIYGDHTLQFRVVSEDRNRVSSWSPLYTVKSLGQYRPYQATLTTNIVSGGGQSSFIITWDTPTIYNYSASLTSASISHNHAQNFKQHPTDVFLRWYNGSGTDSFEYHDRVLTDSTSIVKKTSHVSGTGSGPTYVEVLGLVATHGLSGISGSELDTKLNEIKGYLKIISATVNLSSGAVTNL